MLAAGSGQDSTISQQPPAVVFVVTVRNNADLLDRCLRSIAGQNYQQTRGVVVDDASEDGTAAVAARWAADRPDMFTIHVMNRRRGKMANLYDAVTGLPPHDVVVELDGDDRLLSRDAATDLARLHTRLDLVWTQHRVSRQQWHEWPHFRSTDLPPKYRAAAQLPRLRWSRTWHPSHLRSFKAWAFRQIDREDLTLDGDWLLVCPDVAYFTPLVEMTPPPLRYFYDRELAVYTITARNEKNLDTDTTPPHLRQSIVADQIFQRPPYRTRPAPLWVGLVDAATLPAIERIWAEQAARNPATRFLLASEPMHESWHPRVQVVAQHTIACHDAPAAERARAAMQWMEDHATQQGYTAAGVSRPHDMPLRQFE